MAEKIDRPQLGHSQGHEDLSNTERILVSMLTKPVSYQVLHYSQRMYDAYTYYVLRRNVIPMPMMNTGREA